MQRIKSGKIQITAIHYVNGTGLRDEFIKDVNFMNSGFGNSYKRGDIAPQVQ